MQFWESMSELAFLGIAMMGIAVIIAIFSFVEYARKKMSDSFGMIWLLFSVAVSVLGIMLIVGNRYFSVILLVLTLICMLLLLMIFIISRMVSELVMKVRELAMQVALLNQENGEILKELEKLKEAKENA